MGLGFFFFGFELFAGVLKESYKPLQLQAKSASHLPAHAREERTDEGQDYRAGGGRLLGPRSTDLKQDRRGLGQPKAAGGGAR